MLLANGVTDSGSGEVTTTSVVEIDFPPETVADGLLLAGFAVAAALLVWLIWRDTVRLHPVWRGWLLLLRVGALLGLFVIALNPHQRTQKESFRPSQVVLLVDTSTSMQQPANDPSLAGLLVASAIPRSTLVDLIVVVDGCRILVEPRISDRR